MNVIANMFAFKEDYSASTQLKQSDAGKRYELYMQNMVVSLVSAKLKNPEDEVLLVATDEPPKQYLDILKKYQIRNVIVPYEEKYQAGKEFTWSLIFYRFSALDYLLSVPEYERICLIDTDTLCTRELKELWEECSDAMMLYPVNHSYEHNERKMIRDFYRELREKGSEQYAQCPEQLPLPHYGGEFFCGPAKALREFTEIAKGIFFTFKEKGFPGNPNFNDEHVFSIAAALYRAQGKPVLEAAAYIWRYWTEKRFYLVATNTVYNPVCIWHVPGEKDKGMLLLYRYFLKHGEFPDIPGAAKLLGIAPAKRPYPLMSLYAQWVRRCAGKK